MHRALTLLLPALFLFGCGRSELGPPDSGLPPDSGPPVRCDDDDDCDDGDPCNGAESCEAGYCVAGDPILCDDGIACTADTCDSDTGECVFLPDHDRCELGELCDPEAGGCVRRACTSSEDCDDGLYCNGAEYCESGYCAGGSPPDCDDGIGCTGDRCSESAGGCVHAPDDAVCDDGRFCNGAERCDPSVGCVPGSPVTCTDSDPCTTDSCDEATDSCVFVPRDGDRDGYADCACAPAPCDCDDGDVTVNPGMTEQCRDLRDNDCDGLVDCDDRLDCADDPRCGGGCASDAECDDGLYCNGAERCVAGRCEAGAPPSCLDSVGCTIDSCDEATDSCVHAPDHSACDPGEICDPLRGCVTTGCTSDADCNDHVFCNGRETCSSAGVCVAGSPPRCGDRIPCTVDSCDAALDDCVHRPDDSFCDDGLFCTGEERCDPTAGGCVPGADPCAVPDPCLMSLCDEASRACSVEILDADFDGFPPLHCGGEDCDDGDPRVNPLAAEICDDGADNDCDGARDCDDSECVGHPSCCIPTPEVCDDGVDNDCDGDVDCDDRNCSADPACCIPTGPEVCDDGIDNDCDGMTDCSDVDSCLTDPICTGCFPEVCWDGRDNDCDDLIDCGDSDCDWYPPCSGPDHETDCTNGIDDDFDSLVDCDDPDCDSSPFCPWPDTCTDAVDITGMTLVTGSTALLADDYRPVTAGDPDCAGGRGPDAVYYFVLSDLSLVHMDTFGSSYDTVLYVRAGHCISGPQAECNDDSGGLQSELEFVADPGFYFVFVDGYWTGAGGDFELHISITPLGAEVCDNGFDDDGDGLFDCDDPDCAGHPACAFVPEMGVAACTDGVDNDGDGLVDCDDVEDCAVIDVIGECCNGIDDNFNSVVDEFACACDAAHPCDTGVCYEETVGACGPRCTTIGGDTLCDWIFPGTRCSLRTGTCVY